MSDKKNEGKNVVKIGNMEIVDGKKILRLEIESDGTLDGTKIVKNTCNELELREIIRLLYNVNIKMRGFE